MQSVLPVQAVVRLPLAVERTSSVGSVRPDSSVIQCPVGSVSGTSAGTIGDVSEWPSDMASAWPLPSEPDLGSDFPPLQRITRAARSGPADVVTRKPSASRTIASTRAGWRSVAPQPVASRTRASSTVRAESVTGKSLPVSSRLSSTPAALKKATVSSTVKRASTLRIAGGVLPTKSVSATCQCVTLQRPPPATRILAPSLRAPSTATIDGVRPRPRAVRPAQAVAKSPAAPAPTIAMSTRRAGAAVAGSWAGAIASGRAGCTGRFSSVMRMGMGCLDPATKSNNNNRPITGE